MQHIKSLVPAIRSHIVIITLVISCVALFFVTRLLSEQYLLTVPVNGGQFSEGLVGYPRFINPVLAQNQTDKDLVAILFGSLFQNGKPELADSSTFNEDYTEYVVTLHNDLKFHDGTPLTARDVVYTFDLITDPLVKSPLYPLFIGVSAEEIGANSIRFSLTSGDKNFLERLEFGVISLEQWGGTGLEEFPFSTKNISPIGSGPYKITSMTKNSKEQINSMILSKFSDSYYQPYIELITFRFYDNETTALAAFEERTINNLANISAQELLSLDRTLTETEITTITLPRIFGVFFNLEQTEYIDKETRQIISNAINRQAIVDTVFFKRAKVADGPIAPVSDWYEPAPLVSTGISIDQQLDEAGWIIGTSSLVRINEEGESLAFSLTVPDSKELIQTADQIAQQLEQHGIQVRVITAPEEDFASRIVRRRNYQSVLFGQIVDTPQQLFAFWHSSQTLDPGVNITGYSNKTVDSILERLIDADEPLPADYENLQSQIRSDNPVLFVYSPEFIYALDRDILQVNLSTLERAEDRFDTVDNWYIRTESLLPWFTIN